jgi:hypothetical protein
VSALWKRRPRRSVAWLVTVILAGLLHLTLGRFVARNDLIVEIFSLRPAVVLAAVVLVAARWYLLLFAPGWALHIAIRTALEHRLASKKQGAFKPPAPPS